MCPIWLAMKARLPRAVRFQQGVGVPGLVGRTRADFGAPNQVAPFGVLGARHEVVVNDRPARLRLGRQQHAHVIGTRFVTAQPHGQIGRLALLCVGDQHLQGFARWRCSSISLNPNTHRVILNQDFHF